MEVEVERVTHRYRSRTEAAIAPIDHVFRPGTLTLITGPSGSGKSTLLSILALLLSPSAGSVRWDGTDMRAATDAARARVRAAHVGFVFQDALLDLARTARANVLEAAWLAGMAPGDAEREATALMQRFGVLDHAEHRPGEVSGGQAQRIALCRALVKRPSVIFADEPTGNLDPESAAVVRDALLEQARAGATIVMATHDIAFADAAERSGSAARLRLGS